MIRTISSHHLIITESSLESLIHEVKEELALSRYSLRIQELPELTDVYPFLARENKSDMFEPISSFSPVRSLDEVVLYLHSSGSTGLPKSIPMTHELFSKVVYDIWVESLQDSQEAYCEYLRRLLVLFLTTYVVIATPGLPDFHFAGV
jgi:non-ribosomal peptide synthetase component E (peptide arylation enzyme)